MHNMRGNEDEMDKNGDGKKGGIVYVKILVNYLLAIAVVFACLYIVPRALGFMWPFVVGWIIALIANPIVHFLEKKIKIARKHGTAIFIVLVLALVIGIMYLLTYMLIKQGVSFAKNFPDMYASLSDTVSDAVNGIRDKYSILPEKTRVFVDNFVDHFGEFVNRFITDMVDNTEFSINDGVYIVKGVAEGLLMTVITILLSYFLTAEHDNITKFCRDKMPEGIKKGYSTISRCIISAFGGYFKAQFKIMCVVFAILSVGLLCMRVNYALLFAFIIAFVDFLPVFGAGAVMWPWCIIEVMSGRYLSAVLLFILYIICQAVRQFMQPKMVGDCIGMSPLTTLFFMFVGYRMAGVMGMIIGIPVGMIILSFYREGVFDNLIRGAEIAIGAFNEWRKF
ncbi:MAG: sporulation integral membrane protein YtvI [Lachnospiraceae bacterium]|nr:sporulation integral membrane protein YtvI [Lachnospiraceae bacterium]